MSSLCHQQTGTVLVEAQNWLEKQRYIRCVDVGLLANTFTITPEGLDWIETPGGPDRHQLTRQVEFSVM